MLNAPMLPYTDASISRKNFAEQKNLLFLLELLGLVQTKMPNHSDVEPTPDGKQDLLMDLQLLKGYYKQFLFTKSV